MARLWNVFDGEPFLDNPKLFLFNGGKKMHRSKSTGRFVKNARRKARRNPARKAKRRVSVAVVNPRRRSRVYAANPVRRHRRYRHNPVRHHRRYRRNPSFSLASFGLNKATLTTVAWTAGGMIGTPMLEGFITQYVGAFASNPFGKYVVRIGSAIGLSWAVGKFVGKDAGMKVAAGGLAYIAVGALKEFFPTALGGSTSGMGLYMGARQQPLLGAYQRSSFGSAITAGTPQRLRPQSRY